MVNDSPGHAPFVAVPSAVPPGVNGLEVGGFSDSSGVNSVEGTPHSGSVTSFEEKVREIGVSVSCMFVCVCL